MKARRKGRGRVILVAGLAVPLVALLFWGLETGIQPAGNEQIPPPAETADPMAGSGSAEFVSQQIPLAAAFDNAQPNAAAPAIDSVTNWVQLGAFRNADNAWTMWLKLRRTQLDLLSDLHHEIQGVGQEGRGTIHFLQVGPLMNATEAQTLCHDLAERNIECLAVRRKP
jgi:cell division septation protein DedD